VKIRKANKGDLDATNRVVEAAVMTWQLPERVKRLAMPSYHYNETDLEHYEIVVAESGVGVVGVAAWDTAPHQGPGDAKAFLLHGIYVHPEQQHRGIGSHLLQSAEQAARTHKYDGVLVKAQKDAERFFQASGLEKLDPQDVVRDYENRYWKPLIR
jgi:N-acetylglutamate synthase-like GNAT family acetyltransferase